MSTSKAAVMTCFRLEKALVFAAPILSDGAMYSSVPVFQRMRVVVASLSFAPADQPFDPT